MEAMQRIQGRCVRSEDVAWLGDWIAAHPQWSRKQIARELCGAWDWRDGRGKLKDFAARSFLLKLEARGVIRLPPLRVRRAGSWAWPKNEALAPPQPAPWEASLEQVRPLRIEVVVAGTAAHRTWRSYLAWHHYLGLRVVGENLGYLVRDRDGRDLACLLFGAAAWRCAPRDQFLGWTSVERTAGLAGVTNNTRFLILPWVRVPNLASHVLGAVARRIGADWQNKYRHGLRWLETFVERDRFAGTCYQAANWRCVGETKGRSRQDRSHQMAVPVKAIYLYALGRRNR